MMLMRWSGKAMRRCVAMFALALCLAAQQSVPASSDIADLRRRFQNPPDDSRIMMRWWWFGPAVTDEELERELRIMKAGGIGGVEIQPVYPLTLDDTVAHMRNLPYLSDEFLNALRFASHKASELGMRLDLTLGSGWPYGGPHVPISQAAGTLRIVSMNLDGSTTHVPVPNIAEGERLIGIFLTPSQANSLESFHEIQDIKNGAVQIPAGRGEQEILIFIASRTGQQVKRAAVGAEGFVVNHYDAAAVDNYLHNVGDRLIQAFDQTPPYAVFCDSLEVYGSDWTDDFLLEFQKRRGYDLKPYLPALAMDLGVVTEDVRSDWGRTLMELFNERFTTRVRTWANQHHSKLRMQAYGIPPADLSSYSSVDLPEGEGAEWRRLSATRWASSASHIFGVPSTSSETWTWLHSPVFRATPLDVKAEADLHFLEGINQLIGHGWPYTAPGVAYPGWRFYAAAALDDKNPWWIVMPDISRYLQRVSFLLRQGTPVTDIALYLPTSDALARLRPGHVNLFETLREQIGPDLIGDILDAGYNFDLIDDDALQNTGQVHGKFLQIGQSQYSMVILPGVERIPADAYRKLRRFAESGGIVIATGRLPERAPGMHASEADTAEVRKISQDLFGGASAKSRFIQEYEKLGTALTQALEPDVRFHASAPIGFIHRHTSDAEIYFVVNTGNTRQKINPRFRVSGRSLEFWNPFDGSVAPAPIASSGEGTTVALDLAPYESRVLVFSGRATDSSFTAAVSTGAAPASVDLSSGWQVKFGEGKPTETMEKLHSWTDDERTRDFSGTASYEKVFSLPVRLQHGATHVMLDFGEGTPIGPQKLKAGTQAWLDAPVREAAVVYINDQRAGSVWCPPYRLDITHLLTPGQNRIRIEVANLAINHMSGRSLPDYRLLNLRYGVRFEPQDMDKVWPVAAGLLGPVHLVFETPEVRR